MKLRNYPDTDSLYVELKSQAGAEIKLVGDRLNVDLDASRQIVGVDIDNASTNLDLSIWHKLALLIRYEQIS